MLIYNYLIFIKGGTFLRLQSFTNRLIPFSIAGRKQATMDFKNFLRPYNARLKLRELDS